MIKFIMVLSYIVLVLMQTSSAASGQVIVSDIPVNISVANMTCEHNNTRLPADVSLSEGISETWVDARLVKAETWTWYYDGSPAVRTPLKLNDHLNCGSLRRTGSSHMFYAINCFVKLEGFLCKSKACRNCQSKDCKKLRNSECIKMKNMKATWYQAFTECSGDDGRLLDEDTNLTGLSFDDDKERWVGLVKSKWIINTEDGYKHLTWNPWLADITDKESANCAVMKRIDSDVGWTPARCSVPHQFYCVTAPDPLLTSTLTGDSSRSSTEYTKVLGTFDILVYIGIAVGCAGVFFVLIGVVAKICTRRRRKSLGEVNRQHFESRPSIFEIDQEMGGLSQQPLGGYHYVNDHPSVAMFDRPMTAGSSATLGYMNKGNPEELIVHNNRTISCSALGRMKCEEFNLMDREYIQPLGDDVGSGSGFSTDYDNASSLNDSQIESTYAIRYRLT